MEVGSHQDSALPLLRQGRGALDLSLGCPSALLKLGLPQQPVASAVLTLHFCPFCLLGCVGAQGGVAEAEPSPCSIRNNSAVSRKSHLNPGAKLLVSKQWL